MSFKLLILYDYFDPAYKAGGPIRSLVNLVKLLEYDLDIFILTTNQDHDGSVLEVVADQWIGYGEQAKVQYLSKSNRNYRTIRDAILEVNPDAVYMNGIYSIPFVVFPLSVLRKYKRITMIIAPRGMLQKESLSIKPLKKKVYLALLKYLYLNQNIQWHVTTEQEHGDLNKFLPKNLNTDLIGNVPSFHPDYNPEIHLAKDKVVFGTVALISPMKNIHLILSALRDIREKVEYHLYGPVKDEVYWSKCKQIIGILPENIEVHYYRELLPGEVPAKISDFDFYIQPSKSENFGHSIFEAFNQGIPVIISDQTPWKSLKEKKAGWDVDLNDPNALTSVIREAITMGDQTYLQFRKGARQIAVDYMQSHDFKKLYLELFS